MSQEEIEVNEENVPEITVEAEAVQIIEEPQEIVEVVEEAPVVEEVAVVPTQIVKENKKIAPRRWL